VFYYYVQVYIKFTSSIDCYLGRSVALLLYYFPVYVRAYVIQQCFICRSLDSTVSEDTGIEPRTVAIARRSNQSARSHAQARSHPPARSHPLARSHPQY
jgi:hypothetical protein